MLLTKVVPGWPAYLDLAEPHLSGSSNVVRAKVNARPSAVLPVVSLR